MATEDWEAADDDYWDITGETATLEDVLFDLERADPVAQMLMWEAVQNKNFGPLARYLESEYDIDLEAEWDWADFREWYDAQ